MLGRRRTSQSPPEQTLPEPPAPGKGRPTPRRSEAEAARRRPLVVTDRKAAAKASRERLREERVRTRTAMETGDERGLPPRDRGAARRYARDFVDARWNVGEFVLFAALALVVLTFVPQVQVLAVTAVYFVVLAAGIDSFVLSRQLKKRLGQRFGDSYPPGTVRYGVLRAVQIRRSRLPKPQVRHGQWPT